MHRLWTLLFGAAAVFAVGIFFWAAGKSGYWFPENVSVIGVDIDHLYWVITWITGITFVVVMVLFLWFLWKYGDERRPGKAVFTHGNHTLETVWTAVPAAILVFIAVYQYGAWKEAKFRSHMPDSPLHARVLAGQFEWRIRYPGPDRELYTDDDVEQVNLLHAWKDQDIVLQLESRDVLHSFFVPAARMKQDMVPGMKQNMWFQITRAGEYEIACAELCGWGHYKMKGHLIVHETKADFDRWYQEALGRQNADQRDPSIWERGE
ncbi:MAG: cytochrome c oxidase subunit II [Planctomycetota bacterium]|nr:MAG: cytochrome c oxidase subunit II [Planctomycetota bacterium]